MKISSSILAASLFGHIDHGKQTLTERLSPPTPESEWKFEVSKLAMTQLKADKISADELAETLFESMYDENTTPQDAIDEEIDAMSGDHI